MLTRPSMQSGDFFVLYGKSHTALPSAALAAAMAKGAVDLASTLNLATSYVLFAPMMLATGISLPFVSMTTALAAPLKGAKLLRASPCSPTKNPLELAIRLPSASNVLRVNTAFAAFFTQPGWACAAHHASAAIMQISVRLIS